MSEQLTSHAGGTQGESPTEQVGYRNKLRAQWRSLTFEQRLVASLGAALALAILLFLIAGALAGAAGLLYSLYVTTVRFDQGFQLGLIAFTAAVLGGIGNLPGAVLGAVLIGLIQAFNEGLNWHAPGSDWTQSIVFSILILILVFRPEGLLGERTPEGG
jgi:branched-subunit amino acid ABC-type transport system permease component